MDSEIQDQATSLLNSWLSIEQFQQQKKNQFPRITEQGGPLALAVNLSYIPVKNLTETFQNNPEEAKSHPGTRTTFYVVKFLYAGWSSVATSSSSGAASSGTSGSEANFKRPNPGGGGGSANNSAGSKYQQRQQQNNNNQEVKEKLSSFYEKDHVLLYSFDLVNQRGSYVRNGKSQECCVLSPGMIMTSKVWGNKFEKTFKEQTTDINVFDVVLVQFGMHSIGSSAKENGMMLEIKSYNHLSCLTPSSFMFLAPKMLPSSMQECTLLRNRFADGSHVSAAVPSSKTCAGLDCQGEDGQEMAVDTLLGEKEEITSCSLIKGLYQDMIKGNISSSCFFMRMIPTQANGIFSIGPDDVMKFFIHQPLADLPAATGTLAVHFNAADFIHNYAKALEQKPDLEKSSNFREWVVKLFNVLVLMEAVEMLVVVDTYKSQAKKEISVGGAKNGPKPLINASVMENDSEDVSSGALQQQGPALMDAYVRVNVNVITESLIRANTDGLVLTGSNVAFISSGNLSSIAQYLLVFPYTTSKNNSPLHVAWDTRKINRKKTAAASGSCPGGEVHTPQVSLQDSLRLRQHSTSIITPDSCWESAHAVYLFYEERLVHYFYIPLPQSAIQADTSRLFLSTVVDIASLLPEDCEFDTPSCSMADSAPVISKGASASTTPSAPKKQKKT